MIQNYVEQILNIFNYFDALIITDTQGQIEYFSTKRPKINSLREEEILGENILDVYPSLTRENSTIYEVAKTGKAIFNHNQTFTTAKGEAICAVETTLPIKSGEKVIGIVNVSQYREMADNKRQIKLSLKDKKAIYSHEDLYQLKDMIGKSPKMQQLKDMIKRVSQTDSSVLIYGATGTGKELVAESIHTCGTRRTGPFISQNCAAIPSTLLESILFGTVKGSYTGAEDRKGLFELAQGGTLFLDEINSMEIEIQPKLLKAIEENEIWRVGGHTPIKTDVRIITACNEKPSKAISEGKLREDLFYRISVVGIDLPELKDRGEDVELLTQYYIEKYNREMNKDIKALDDEVVEIFNHYAWPGNVRELKNVVERAFNLTSKHFIGTKDLPEYMKYAGMQAVKVQELIGGKSLPDLVASYEESLIKQALSKTDNLVEAADLLKISKQSLNYKVKKYQLKLEE
ncbi:MAG: sigma 54-interacting transcriptional regulator [Tissierellia bacterium]|nr:sigma 54-interacting transcriptional regulator [Tissierellia bacterium]